VHKSKRYMNWERTAGWELAIQRPARITGPVTVVISAGRPDRRRRDIDNLAKSLLDLLVAHRVMDDDSLVRSVTSRWDDQKRALVSARKVVTEQVNATSL
jgi:crossover junction endodeoxyribonuclease RusA